MEVEFEFLLGGNRYRVIRKRQQRKTGPDRSWSSRCGMATSWRVHHRRHHSRHRARDRRAAAHGVRDLHQQHLPAAGARRRVHRQAARPSASRSWPTSWACPSTTTWRPGPRSRPARMRTGARILADACARSTWSWRACRNTSRPTTPPRRRAAAQAAVLRGQEDELRVLREAEVAAGRQGAPGRRARLRVTHAQARADRGPPRPGRPEPPPGRARESHRPGAEIEGGHAGLQAARQDAESPAASWRCLARLQQDQALDQAIASQRHALDSARQVLAAQVADRQTRAAQAEALAARAAGLGSAWPAWPRRRQEREAGRDSPPGAVRAQGRACAPPTSAKRRDGGAEAQDRGAGRRGQLPALRYGPHAGASRGGAPPVRGRGHATRADAFRANTAEMDRLERRDRRAEGQHRRRRRPVLQDQPALQRQEAATEQSLAGAPGGGRAMECCDCGQLAAGGAAGRRGLRGRGAAEAGRH